MTNANQTKRIAQLNDELRHAMIPTGGNYRVLTRGVAALDMQDQFEIMRQVRAFDAFNEDNDPHEEHDFGALQRHDQKIFWKIDYYAPDLKHGSDDPSDSNQTVRVLTIMLAEEY